MNVLEKNLLILASAGSGKTYQLGNRVIGLVADGVPPEQIVALTFTRKAAGEFADSVLSKLAKAASDGPTAEALRHDLARPEADFGATLERVVRALPQFTLGTMDSFFAKVVRGFQYELGLTGGTFDLLEGPRQAAAQDELLTSLLGETLQGGGGEAFFQAFRRAMVGKEDLKVLAGLREFVKQWHARYRANQDADWGPAGLAGVDLDDWEQHKHQLIDQLTREVSGVTLTDKRQEAALADLFETLRAHTIGSGSLGGAKSLLASVLAAVAGTPTGPLEVKYQKAFVIGGAAGDRLRAVVELAARCELAAALGRTRAVREVMAVYDTRCEQRLRRRGKLGFDDVKFLMGEWVKTEDARLRREAVDFRLDARHEHWLLDEFQDTSRADWLGLLPLLDEAAAAGGGSLFIVGDRKQAIYAWRGGEVGLFDEVMRRYQGGLKIEQMAESRRSCPEVLELVNQVCGDMLTLRDLFGVAAGRWQWQEHVAAAPLQTPARRGEARVEVVEGKWEGRLERLIELLGELEIGRRALTCGVLVRNNEKVRAVADALREAGFEVIEEGRREPAKDHPVGVVLWHLLQWLADPAHAFAREVVAMSPLAAVLDARFGESWPVRWEGLSARAAELGFAGMIEELVEACWLEWSEFGRRRAGDLMGALAELDAQGGGTMREAADRVGRLEVSQSPGVAAVQVMTIHKAKGLGFDVVVVPDVPTDGVPQAQHFTVAEGDGWLCQTPPKWAREIISEIREAEESWAADQQYEAMCMLYVALTRGKRGLYVLLDPPPKTQEDGKASLANWVAAAVGSTGRPGPVYQRGSPDWIAGVPMMPPVPAIVGRVPLGVGVTRRQRLRPSGTGPAHAAAGPPNVGALRFGTSVHAALERVGWLDEATPELPADEAGRAVAEVLAEHGVRALFERRGRSIELFREQSVDAVIDGKWLCGVIDRLHLHRDPGGVVSRVEVIDFKTDAVTDPTILLDRHAGQLRAYQQALALAYPRAEVVGWLVSTRLRQVVAVP